MSLTTKNDLITEELRDELIALIRSQTGAVAGLQDQINALACENRRLEATLDKYAAEIRKCDIEKEFGDRVLLHVCDFVTVLENTRDEQTAYKAVSRFMGKVCPLIVEYSQTFKELREQKTG